MKKANMCYQHILAKDFNLILADRRYEHYTPLSASMLSNGGIPLQPTEKYCGKCGETKPITEFYKRSDRPIGVQAKCKLCSNNSKKNPQYKERFKAYCERPEIAEHRREISKKHYIENKAEILERQLKLRTENKEHIKARHHAYYERTKEERLASGKKWYANNPKTVAAKWHRRRARLIGNGGRHTALEWETLKAKYDFTCLMCHKKEPIIKLTMDHVIPISKGGTDNIDNLQPLCYKCNREKHADVLDLRH